MFEYESLQSQIKIDLSMPADARNVVGLLYAMERTSP